MVKVGEEWFTLVSLDGIETEEIVAFSQRTYKNKWQKRFGEDLVEVLAGMGHQTKRTVRLVVSPLDLSMYTQHLTTIDALYRKPLVKPHR